MKSPAKIAKTCEIRLHRFGKVAVIYSNSKMVAIAGLMIKGREVELMRYGISHTYQ